MEFSYKKKKIFTTILRSLFILIVLVSALAFIFNYINGNKDTGPLLIIPILLLLPAAIAVSIYMLRLVYQLLKPEKLLLRIDEQGILLYLNKGYRKAGLIGWNKISNITTSTDNMNLPAIRISLEGHINSVYQFYITTPDAKKMGLPLAEVFDTIMAYYNANRR